MRGFLVLAVAAVALQADPIKMASDAIGVAAVKTLRVTGFGASEAGTVKSYELLVNYDTPAMQIDVVRAQRAQQAVNGATACNVPFDAGVAQPPQLANAAAAERTQMLWTTPHGFLKAAAANKAVATRAAAGTEVTFTAGGRRFAGLIGANNQLARVQTWIDGPAGEQLVETVYSSYQKFSDGVAFPMRIVQRAGGRPSLDLWISSVTPNPAVTIEVPEALKAAAP